MIKPLPAVHFFRDLDAQHVIAVVPEGCVASVRAIFFSEVPLRLPLVVSYG